MIIIELNHCLLQERIERFKEAESYGLAIYCSIFDFLL